MQQIEVRVENDDIHTASTARTLAAIAGLQRRLEYQAGDEDALGNLRTVNSVYFSDPMKVRIAELVGEETPQRRDRS